MLAIPEEVRHQALFKALKQLLRDLVAQGDCDGEGR